MYFKFKLFLLICSNTGFASPGSITQASRLFSLINKYEKIVEANCDYRTGVIYTTNRRLWEHDKVFLKKLKKSTAIGIDMEVATIFVTGHYNEIARGALLLVSDVPTTPEGVKTEESDKKVTSDWSKKHLEIGIKSMTEIEKSGEKIKHFRY